ncbi:protein FAM124B [Nannospalax galili]|uniref:Family with sequence similarity 124, member B n=1 Tax=Nannospalax galili TaxID=1026970 RepID=A0A8C6RTY2_NANGA|nr:protein FAM124B [Nannospalax galili]
MEGTQEPLVMIVHLLADSGHGSLLQRALDQLLDCIWPEVHLFLVSERVRRVSYHEKYHPRRARFPGMSVLLFLQESLGEERLFRVLDFLRNPPWQGFPTHHAQGKPCPYLPPNQEFYSLHNQMPVWGVRQVHCGTEILRVTLYCSFDNYEDAIRLYEMILQREATVQKSNFCFFVLYATEGFSLQLSLKQLPLGMSVDPKDSSVLQFKVQEIGQLVPLLPNPCVPISSTRWQTQDYDGNKILLQVQSKPGLAVRSGELSLLNGSLRGDMNPQGSLMNPVSAQRTVQPRSQRSWSRRFKVRSLELAEPSGTLENASGHLWKSPGWFSQASSSVMGTQRHLLSPPMAPGIRMNARKESSFQKLEAETDVDTGFTVINSEPRRSFLSRFPRDFQMSPPPHCLSGSSLEPTASQSQRLFKERVGPLSLPGQRDFGAKIISKCSHHLPVQGEGKEEFFI